MWFAQIFGLKVSDSNSAKVPNLLHWIRRIILFIVTAAGQLIPGFCIVSPGSIVDPG